MFEYLMALSANRYYPFGNRLARSLSTSLRLSSKIDSLVKVKFAERLQGMDNNVWVSFSELTRRAGVVNVGQGLPDYHPPSNVLKALQDVASADQAMLHQCTRPYGHPRLVEAIAKLYSPLHERELDPLKEIMVSNGAQQSLYYSFQGLIDPGDDVIIIEPFFDSYVPLTLAAGGKPVCIPLKPDEDGRQWRIDIRELAEKFCSKTKLIVLNTPNNPAGKVFTREELMQIAELCKANNVVCIADEVYEFIVYPSTDHVRISTLPGMWERTITISSAGKAFTATGWRLGWSIGPEYLIKALMIVHQNCVHACNTPLQETVARALESELSTPQLCKIPAELLPKRDLMVQALHDVGMTPTIPDGSYFILANWTKLNVNPSVYEDGSDDRKDFKFSKWLIKEKGLATIPSSPFFSNANKQIGEDYLRICFCKKQETLDNAVKIIKTLK